MSAPSRQLGLSDSEYEHTKTLLRQMKVAELKMLCKALFLPLKGLKNELLQRLVQYFEQGKQLNDNIRLLAVRTMILKLMQGQPIPDYQQLSHALQSGAFIQEIPNQYTHAGNAISHSNPSKLSGVILLFKPSPFYSQRRMVKGSPFFAKPCLSKDARASVQINFMLTAEERLLLQSKPSMKLFLFAGLNSASTSDVDVEFPTQVELNCNGNVIRSSYKGLKHMKGTASPANLTPFVKQADANVVTMIYVGTVEPFFLYLYIVETYSSEQVFEIAAKNPHIHRESTVSAIKKEYEESDNDDIVMATSTISLKCPLSISRMTNPAKGIFCQHLQCFDLQSFIYSQETIPDWRCPICQNKIKLNDLAINDYLLEALKNTHEDVESISLHKDGSWEPVLETGHTDSRSPAAPAKTPTMEKKFMPSTSPAEKNNSFPGSDDIIEIIDSESEDEAPLPQQAPPSLPPQQTAPLPPTQSVPSNPIETNPSSDLSNQAVEGLPIATTVEVAPAPVEDTAGSSPYENDEMPLSYFSQFLSQNGAQRLKAVSPRVLSSISSSSAAPSGSTASVSSGASTGTSASNTTSGTTSVSSNIPATSAPSATLGNTGAPMGNTGPLPTLARSTPSVVNSTFPVPTPVPSNVQPNVNSVPPPSPASASSNNQGSQPAIVEPLKQHPPVNNSKPTALKVLPPMHTSNQPRTPGMPHPQDLAVFQVTPSTPSDPNGIALHQTRRSSQPNVPTLQQSDSTQSVPTLQLSNTPSQENVSLARWNSSIGMAHERDNSSPGGTNGIVLYLGADIKKSQDIIDEQNRLLSLEMKRLNLALLSLQAGFSRNLDNGQQFSFNDYDLNLRRAALLRVGIELQSLFSQTLGGDHRLLSLIKEKQQFCIQIQKELLAKLRKEIHDLQLKMLQQSTAEFLDPIETPSRPVDRQSEDAELTIKSLKASLINTKERETVMLSNLEKLSQERPLTVENQNRLTATMNYFNLELQKLQNEEQLILSAIQLLVKHSLQAQTTGDQTSVRQQQLTNNSPPSFSSNTIAPNEPVSQTQSSIAAFGIRPLPTSDQIPKVLPFDTIMKEQERQKQESAKRRLNHQQAQASFSKSKDVGNSSPNLPSPSPNVTPSLSHRSLNQDQEPSASPNNRDNAETTVEPVEATAAKNTSKSAESTVRPTPQPQEAPQSTDSNTSPTVIGTPGIDKGNETTETSVSPSVETAPLKLPVQISEPEAVNDNSSSKSTEETPRPPRFSQSAFDLAMNKDNRKSSHLVKGMLGIQILEDVINDSNQTPDEAHAVSPLNFRVTNMTLETPNAKKRSLSNTEKLWNKRLNSNDQLPIQHPPEVTRKSLKTKFDPSLVNKNDIIELDEQTCDTNCTI